MGRLFDYRITTIGADLRGHLFEGAFREGITICHITTTWSHKDFFAVAILIRPSKKKCLFAKIRVAKKYPPGRQGIHFFCLIFRLYLQTKFSKEQKK